MSHEARNIRFRWGNLHLKALDSKVIIFEKPQQRWGKNQQISQILKLVIFKITSLLTTTTQK